MCRWRVPRLAVVRKRDCTSPPGLVDPGHVIVDGNRAKGEKVMKSAKLMRLVAMVAVSVVLAIIACGPSALQHQSEGDGAVDRTPEFGSVVTPGSKDFVQLTSWPTHLLPTSVSRARPTPAPTPAPETHDVMEIVEAYFDNPVAAKQKYDDRPLLVQGTVREIMEQGIEFTTLHTMARPGASSFRDMYWREKMWQAGVVSIPLASVAFEHGNLHQLASLTRMQKVTLLCDNVKQLDETTALGGCQMAGEKAEQQ